ncbi:unnamed protein product, partial [Amoebophrya sp. A120]
GGRNGVLGHAQGDQRPVGNAGRGTTDEHNNHDNYHDHHFDFVLPGEVGTRVP